MRRFSKKRKAVLLCVFGLLMAGGLIGFPLLIGSLLTAPAAQSVTLPELFRGSEVSFSSKSGATLRGNLLRGKRRHGLVILMHGVRGHRGAMVKHAEFLHRAGHSVLIFDFQAHGESSGVQITSGYRESMDAAAAVEFAKSAIPGEKVGVLGSSLGGAATILADPPLAIDAAVLELVYADIERAVKNRIALVLGNWARPFSVLLTSQLRPRLGVSPSWLSPSKKIRRLQCPIFILAGANDRHTTLADTQEVFTNAREPKDLWIVENAAHENLHRTAGRDYEQRILAFFQRHLVQQGTAAK